MADRTKTFVFTFDVSDEFLRSSPAADEYVAACKRRIAARLSATGPRGGMYRLVTPPDEWRQSQDGYAFARNATVFGTKRQGRYVRPDRIPPELRLGDSIHFDSLTVPVVDGKAVLPSGKTVETPSPYLSFPVLVP